MIDVTLDDAQLSLVNKSHYSTHILHCLELPVVLLLLNTLVLISLLLLLSQIQVRLQVVPMEMKV